MVIHAVEYTTPADGTNLLAGYPEAISMRRRKIMKIGFTGGAAIADGNLKVSIGNRLVCDIRNTSTSIPPVENDIRPEGGDIVPAKMPVSAIIDGTGADNYFLYIDFKDM